MKHLGIVLRILPVWLAFVIYQPGLALAAPEILTQPQSVQARIGTEATFSVTATSSVQVAYQWYEGAAPLLEQTSASLVLPGVQPRNQLYQREYYAVVTDASGSVTSVVAILNILAPPPSPSLLLSGQPANQSVRPGSDTSFSVSAQSEFPLSYQWFEDGVELLGETNATVTITNIQVRANTYYRRYHALVTDQTGGVLSGFATLTILVNPAILQQPVPQSVIVGGNLELWVEVTGTPPFGFRWRKGGATAGLSTEPRIVIPITQVSQAGLYSVIITNQAAYTPGILSHSVAVTVGGDADSNGIPDNWQTLYGLDPARAGRDADPDQDGISNYNEYISGTDPLRAESVLKFLTVSSDPASAVVSLGWLAASNTTYTVQWQFPNIAPGWLKLSDTYSEETNRLVTITHFNNNRSSVFYRLVSPKIR